MSSSTGAAPWCLALEGKAHCSTVPCDLGVARLVKSALPAHVRYMHMGHAGHICARKPYDYVNRIMRQIHG